MFSALPCFQKDLLTAAFGSKRKQRQLNARLKFAVKSEDIESVVNKSLNETTYSPEDSKKLLKTFGRHAKLHWDSIENNHNFNPNFRIVF